MATNLEISSAQTSPELVTFPQLEAGQPVLVKSKVGDIWEEGWAVVTVLCTFQNLWIDPQKNQNPERSKPVGLIITRENKYKTVTDPNRIKVISLINNETIQ